MAGVLSAAVSTARIGVGAPPEGLTACPFEAEFLGGPVYRLDADGPAADAVAWARGADVRLISRRRPGEAHAPAAGLAQAGFRQVERLVTLQRQPTAVATPDIRLATPGDSAAVIALAAGAFRFDRFHADPAISDAAADGLKAAWVRNGLGGRADWPLVAVDARDQPVGFNLVMIREDAAVIDLIAVAPDAQGRGYGRQLVAAALDRATQAGLRAVRVGTQTENAASLALYAAMGFAQIATATTFHWTPAGGAP